MKDEENKACGCAVDSVQNKLLNIMFEKQLQASQNNLEASQNNYKASQNYLKGNRFFFFGMIFAFMLSIALSFGYFYFYDFEYEIIEEEIVETSEDIYQSAGDSVINSKVEQNMSIGDK